MVHKLVRIVAVICLALTMACPFVISGDALADSPDNCWRVVIGPDPVTLTLDEGYYSVSDSAFRYDGTSYTFSAYYLGALVYVGDGNMYPVMAGYPMVTLDGLEDVDVSVYTTLYTGDEPYFDVYMTVYYPHYNKSEVDACFTELSGEGNWSCDATFEGIFVNEGEGYVYHAPTPICVPAPTPTIPSGQTLSEIIMPEYNESSGLLWSASAVNQSDAVGDPCSAWYSIWGEGLLFPGIGGEAYGNIVASAITGDDGGAMLARNLLAFDTSEIPDDAIIAVSYLRFVPYMWAQIFSTSGTGVRLGGTYNSSILPINLSEYMGMNYSESEFYGDFGGFDFIDIPIDMMAENTNGSLYMDVWLNNSGLEYINTEGLTVLTLRAEEDADYECPTGTMNMSMSEMALWAGNLSGLEPALSPTLFVYWHVPTEPTPTPDACWDVVSEMVDPPTLTYGEDAWQLSRSAFRYDGIDWDGGSGFTYFWSEGTIMLETGEGSSWIEPDGTVQIDVGLYEINGEGGWQYYTIYYINGDKAEMEAFFDYYEYDWVCSAYHEGVFIGNGSAYTYHQPCTEEEPIIPVGPVSAVLIILGLVFTVLGLLGIMAVLFKGESLMLSVKIGVLVGLSIFAIIGITIIESIIVALTGG